MQVAQENDVISASLDAWLERLGLEGEPLRENITHAIQVLDQTGRAAVARFDGGWRIVAKTFHSH